MNVKEYAENIVKEICEAYERGELEEWVDDQLDIDFDTWDDETFYNAEIFVTYGGPTAWVDVASKRKVFVHFGSEQAECDIPDEEVTALEEYARFLFMSEVSI
jgi:hypothetical protein